MILIVSVGSLGVEYVHRGYVVLMRLDVVGFSQKWFDINSRV